MPKLMVNFDDVPDKPEALPAGVYEFLITDVSLEETKKKTGHNLVVELEVTEGDHKGRKTRDYIFQNERGQIKTKHLCKSAGLSVGADGLDTDDLKGLVCKAAVKNRVYTDPDTEVEQETNDIQDYHYDEAG